MKVEGKKPRVKPSLPAADREIWSAKDIMERWNIGATTFWRYRKLGHLPAADAKIGPHDAWYRNTILTAEQRTNAPAAG